MEPTNCKTLHDRLVNQLDTLVPFLALAHREVFDVLSAKYSGWYPVDQQGTLPDSYEAYCSQVAHAAFLLGYSYAEAFVTDLMWLVYSVRRDLLPRERTLLYSEVLSRADFETVLNHMIDCTVSEMNSLEKKLSHLEKRFGLSVTQPELMLEAHVARNAIVHNAGRMNRGGASSARWRLGDAVELSVNDVHDFGIMARSYTLELCEGLSALCVAKPN